MTKVYFAMYKFRIRRKHTPKLEENYLSFDEIINEDINLTFRDILIGIFLENTFINDNLRVTDQLDFDDERGIYVGLLDLGEYGNLRKVSIVKMMIGRMKLMRIKLFVIHFYLDLIYLII